MAWVSSIAKLTAGEVMAIDGKTLCGTREAGKKALVHMVSAWASANNLVLAQRKVDEKSNEITAIPKLLNALELAGTVVTVDAMGCQCDIASLIIEKKADYVLAVKDNQGLLAEQVRDSFLLLSSDAVAEDIDCAGNPQSGSGRVEQRRCSVIADLSMIEKAAEWASLQGLVRIESERYHKATGKTEREIRYYITSLRPDAARLNSVIRQHWGIENKLHWVLDVGFSEDLDRKRAGHAAQNFSLLNRIVLNLLKQETTFKRGIKENDSKPHGTIPTCSNYWEFDMRRPWQDYPFYPLNPTLSWTPTARWWPPRLRDLKDASGLGSGEISERLLAIEWFPYHSKSPGLPRTLVCESQKYTFQLEK